MVVPFGGEAKRAPAYKPYRNEQFNKKMGKASALIKSIDETSLRPEDKRKLKDQIKELFS